MTKSALRYRRSHLSGPDLPAAPVYWPRGTLRTLDYCIGTTCPCVGRRSKIVSILFQSSSSRFPTGRAAVVLSPAGAPGDAGAVMRPLDHRRGWTPVRLPKQYPVFACTPSGRPDALRSPNAVQFQRYNAHNTASSAADGTDECNAVDAGLVSPKISPSPDRVSNRAPRYRRVERAVFVNEIFTMTNLTLRARPAVRTDIK